MSTNVRNTDDKSIGILSDVCVPVKEGERILIEQIFSMWGMKKAFMNAYKDTKRDNIYNALKKGKYRLDILTNMRQFIKDNRASLNEFVTPEMWKNAGF